MCLPREPRPCGDPGPREDDSIRSNVRVPRQPGACSAPRLREDDISHTVVRSPPEPGKRCARSPREDHSSIIIVRLPLALGTLGDPGPHGNDTRRAIARAKLTTLQFTSSTT